MQCFPHSPGVPLSPHHDGKRRLHTLFRLLSWSPGKNHGRLHNPKKKKKPGKLAILSSRRQQNLPEKYTLAIHHQLCRQQTLREKDTLRSYRHASSTAPRPSLLSLTVTAAAVVAAARVHCSVPPSISGIAVDSANKSITRRTRSMMQGVGGVYYTHYRRASSAHNSNGRPE